MPHIPPWTSSYGTVELLGEQYMWARPKHLDLSVIYERKRHDKVGKRATAQRFQTSLFWKRAVLYDFEPGTKIFNGFELVQGLRTVELLGEQYMWARPKHLDLSVVYERKRHDKVGNERLLRDFKLHYFGNEHTNLSREECEAFFDCDSNFAEPPNLSRFFKKRVPEEV
jgi:hypothetical protein